MKTLNICLLLLVCTAGCATRGGWPCWAWSSNTDQKSAAYSKRMLEQQNFERTNTAASADLNRMFGPRAAQSSTQAPIDQTNAVGHNHPNR